MSVLNVENPACMQDDEINMFQDAVNRFYERHASPETTEQWRQNHMSDLDIWKHAGEAGLLCASIPMEYGGSGGDFRHEVVIIENSIKHDAGGFGITLHNAILAPYILLHGTEEQKQRWLPRLATGELRGAIAMSEPGTGSDLSAVRTTAVKDGDDYVINGQKTFISNGQVANLICVVTKTDTSAGSRGVSLMMVETEAAEGFRRGRILDKVGCESQDTSELFFEDVRVPKENLLGLEEGKGFVQLMKELPKERLIIALQGIYAMEIALEHTVEYVKERKVFGQRVMDYQNTQFKLAECKTQATVAKVFTLHCLDLLMQGKLDDTMASMAKLHVSEAQGKLVDECLQLFGGYGYMNEYPIARLYRDARGQRIWGGTSEIMKLVISRSM
ncbi:MAG: acyl-CoA dehydrogenase [Cellvibrionaceae bacterium]|nr:acyl-CoA dehydrogenase [Cellvibrionaceae bacterium]